MSGLVEAIYDPSWPEGWELDRLIDRFVLESEIATVRKYTEYDAVSWVLSGMQRRGYWCQMSTPFDASDRYYWAGFTPRGSSGWNGVSDYRAAALTLPQAIGYAALLTTVEGRKILGAPMVGDGERKTDGTI